MSKIATKHAETALERDALKWLNQDGDAENSYRDLMQGGCQSGTVGHLIYYRDTTKFYKRHQAEISAMLSNLIKELGAEGPKGVFGNKWDEEDPLAREDLNQNLLAWFGFEEAARTVAIRAGIED